MSHLPRDTHRRLEGSQEPAPPPDESMAHTWSPRRLLRQANELRQASPVMLTCPASRHVQLMAANIMGRRGVHAYPMLLEDPSYCAASMLAAVVNLYVVRSELHHLRKVAKAALPANWADDYDTARLAVALGVNVRGEA